jgi:hypothetical protein
MGRERQQCGSADQLVGLTELNRPAPLRPLDRYTLRDPLVEEHTHRFDVVYFAERRRQPTGHVASAVDRERCLSIGDLPRSKHQSRRLDDGTVDSDAVSRSH